MKCLIVFYLQEREPCYYSCEGGLYTKCTGRLGWCEAKLAVGIRGLLWSVAFLAAPIHGASRSAAACTEALCLAHALRALCTSL